MTVNGEQMEQMDRFKYLGSWITSAGRSDIDINCRIGQAKNAFMDMRNVLRSRKVRLGIRTHLLQY